MTQTRQKRALNPLWRAATIIAIALGIAFALKTYKDHAPTPETQAQGRAREDLAKVVEALGRAKPEAWGALTTPTDWYPNALPCASEAPYGATPDTWRALTPELKLAGSSHYQLRLHREGESMIVLARRDRDCDGRYEVLHQPLTRGWDGGASAGALTTRNAGD